RQEVVQGEAVHPSSDGEEAKKKPVVKVCKAAWANALYYFPIPQQFLYFLPLPHLHKSLRPTWSPFTTGFFFAVHPSSDGEEAKKKPVVK
ncbi:hypothetical protein ACT453_49835, partial [Bacillus sp. D-CC]